MSNVVKPRFGIDIDGTVTCPATLIPHINKQYNINMTLDDIVEYSFLSAFPHPVDPVEFGNWFKAAEPDMYRVSELAANAKETLLQWQNQFELIYITARSPHLEAVTIDWFKEFGVPYDHIQLLGDHNKVGAAKSFGVDVFFEDKHDNAVSIAEELNIPVLLFDTPYNRQAVPQNVHRINNWLEAKNWIERNF